MSAAALKLDCFSRPEPELQPPEPDDSAAAFERGYATGFEAAQSLIAENLARQLGQLGEQLEQERQDDLRRRRDILGAITPLLGGIIDVLGPAGARDQLGAMLTTELARLVESAPLKRCTIRCHSEFEDTVQAHAESYDGKMLRIESGPDFEGVELSVDGGIIVFDPRFATNKIKSMIENLLCGAEP
ncbi:hypothetical protein QWZ10_13190 [Paracoccus cavernae]|uniref:Flagellar assembly protein FliH/Type III secretion system HrpE domain-containing protein n=1 Tax=Paracoccus cavernae TaxID=1571207 RepID=A0ABT8D804_9RHOB|nr:hypothetical protein [Paracoccus cavernae]